MKKSDRKERLEKLSNEERTMIFHEAPHKLRDTLDDFEKYFGADRKISLCRELTKLNEEVMRVTLGEAVAYYKENDPRGEYVLVVEGGVYEESDSQLGQLSVEEAVDLYMSRGMPKMDAIKKVAKERGIPKNEVYKLFNND